MPTGDTTRVYRAMIVNEFGDRTLGEYLRETSRADDGRDPAAEQPSAADMVDAVGIDRGEDIRTDGGTYRNERLPSPWARRSDCIDCDASNPADAPCCWRCGGDLEADL